MITNVLITNRGEAPSLVQSLVEKGNKTCWITISSKNSKPLCNRSNKTTLVVKFDDVLTDPITKNQVRKIKNFIANHHINSAEEKILVINCHAGISRSAAIGMWCLHVLGLRVQFGKETRPNVSVMKHFNIPATIWTSY